MILSCKIRLRIKTQNIATVWFLFSLFIAVIEKFIFYIQ